MGLRRKRAEHDKLGLSGNRAMLTHVLIVGLLLLLYLPSLRHDFVAWDDDLLFTQNPYYQPVSLKNILYFWTHAYKGWYTPVANTLGAVIAWATQRGEELSPVPFHAFNLFCHILSVILVFHIILAVLSRTEGAKSKGEFIGLPGPYMAALFGALLFGAHPLQVESVAWVSAIKDVLAGMFSLFALWQYFRYTQAGLRLNYVLCLVAFLFGLLSKPNSLGLPFVIFVFELWIFRRPAKRVMALLSPMLFLFVVFVILNKVLQPDAELRFAVPLWARPVIAGDALAFYIFKLLLPISLGPDYGRNPGHVLSHWWGYFTWIVPFSLAVLLAMRQKSWFYAYMVMISGLIPVLGFIPFYFQTYSTVADRYLYLPMLGPAIVFSILSRRLQRTQLCALIPVIICLSTVNVFQQRVWANTDLLFTHALSVNPRSTPAHKNKAAFLIQRGMLDEAASHLNEVLKLDPSDAEAHNNLGLILEQQGKLSEAASHYRTAAKLKAEYAEPYINMGNLYSRQKRFSDALRMYQKAASIDASNAAIFNNMGFALFQMGSIEEAIEAYSKATRLSPRFAEAYANLGNAFMSRGDLENAERALQTAASLNPALRQVHNSLAVVLFQLGDYEGAWREVNIFVQQGGTPHPDFLRALSAEMPNPNN